MGGHLSKDSMEASGVTGFEQRVAMMRAAGATQASIAMLCEVSQELVSQVLRKPRVANMILSLTAAMGTTLAPAINDVNVAIESAAAEAFNVELESMRDLHGMGKNELGILRPEQEIKAKVSASVIAQDILDRAGKRAPTKVINATVNVPAEALGHVADVVREINISDFEEI